MQRLAPIPQPDRRGSSEVGPFRKDWSPTQDRYGSSRSLEGVTKGISMSWRATMLQGQENRRIRSLRPPWFSPGRDAALIAYDEGVNRGRIHPCKLVQVLSENPAKIFGLYPKKGTLEKGSDADLVLFDPKETMTIQSQNQHSGAQYTVYEGRKCLGKPVLTMQRGKVIVENGKMKAKPGEGKFVPTRITKVKC